MSIFLTVRVAASVVSTGGADMVYEGYACVNVSSGSVSVRPLILSLLVAQAYAFGCWGELSIVIDSIGCAMFAGPAVPFESLERALRRINTKIKTSTSSAPDRTQHYRLAITRQMLSLTSIALDEMQRVNIIKARLATSSGNDGSAGLQRSTSVRAHCCVSKMD